MKMQNDAKDKKTRKQTEKKNQEHFDYNINIPYPRNGAIYYKFKYKEHKMKF